MSSARHSRFASLLRKLKTLSVVFGTEAAAEKARLLAHMKRSALPRTSALARYYEVLLFLSAYPDNAMVQQAVAKELDRIASRMKRWKSKDRDLFVNSGLPFSTCYSSFSHDCLRWLLQDKGIRVVACDFRDGATDFNTVLSLTLPSQERSSTTCGYDNDGLLEALRIDKENPREVARFFTEQLSGLDMEPFIKDHLFNSLNLFTRLALTEESYSKSGNRMNSGRTFFHDGLLRNFSADTLIRSAIPAPVRLTRPSRQRLADVIRRSMVLTDRETDPATYMDIRSLRLYLLERGISVAVYGMVPLRQMPLESYVGYTAFKNGFPVAYGGGWVFGPHSDIGINIFEPFRGGESGYIFCQVLRVYKQVFGIERFEVEAYQFGLDNPEGIESGAFWFWFRYGFRPVDAGLRALALQEHKRITSRQGTRSSRKTLIRFTGSPMALPATGRRPLRTATVTSRVTRWVALHYGGNRGSAVEASVRRFRAAAGFRPKGGVEERHVLEEVALWAAAYEIRSRDLLQLMAAMVRMKPADLYGYQQLLQRFFVLYDGGGRTSR